jgi:type IV secretory pathway component VirB8
MYSLGKLLVSGIYVQIPCIRKIIMMMMMMMMMMIIIIIIIIIIPTQSKYNYMLHDSPNLNRKDSKAS